MAVLVAVSKEKLPRIVVIGAWGSAIGGLATLLQYVSPFHPFTLLGEAVAWTWGWFLAGMQFRAPVWVFLAILGAGLLLLCVALLVLGRSSKGLTVEGAHLGPASGEDTFWGVNWHWRWGSEGPRNLVALCPSCRNELDWDGAMRGGLFVARFRCGNCGHVALLDREGSPEELAAREIRRRERLKFEGRTKTNEGSAPMQG